MRAMTTVAACLCLGIMATTASAGVRIGNGGGAWACLEPTAGAPLRWLEVVDLFEARRELGLDLRELRATEVGSAIEEQRLRLVSIAPEFAAQVAPVLDWVLAHLRFVDGELAEIEDIAYRVRPHQSECRDGQIAYVQLANYRPGSGVLVQRLAWERLDTRQRAALVLHEAVYATLRQLHGDLNSVGARRIVGYLFSDRSAAEIADVIAEALRQRHDVSFTRDVYPVLQSRCGACHGGQVPPTIGAGGPRDVYWTLNGSSRFLNRSWPEHSRILWSDGHGGGANGSFDPAERQVVLTWIDEGAIAN
jgi:mono/diheme cytochrome c family protein